MTSISHLPLWHFSAFSCFCGAAAPSLVRCRSTCVHHFTNKLQMPPLLLLCNQFACVTGFVLTWMFCVKNSIISKCSYCLHNLNKLLVKQENIVLRSEARKPLHCWLLKGDAVQRWKQPSYVQPFLTTGGLILGKMDLGSELEVVLLRLFLSSVILSLDDSNWIIRSSRVLPIIKNCHTAVKE